MLGGEGMRKALIEADECVYTPGFASQHMIYRVYMNGEEEDGWIASFRYSKPMKEWMKTWGLVEGEDVTIEKELEVGNLHLALYNARMYVETILKNTRADDYCLFFSGKHNIRTDIATIAPYKGNRDPLSKPFYYQQIKDFLQKNYKHEVMEGLEADDGCSIAHWENWGKNNTIIASKDKDLKMVPGLLYNTQHNILYNITIEEACKTFYKQLLIGDKTDNIPGRKEVLDLSRNTPTKWNKEIDKMETEEEMYEYVLELYEGNIEAIKEIGNLLWMRQHKDQMYEPGVMYYGI